VQHFIVLAGKNWLLWNNILGQVIFVVIVGECYMRITFCTPLVSLLVNYLCKIVTCMM